MLREEIKKYKSESVPYQIAKLKLLMAKVFGRCLKKEAIALTPEQMQVLGFLLEKENCFMNEISNELVVDNSAVTRLVDTLEAKGFVGRSISKADRRQRVVSITKLGEQEILKTAKMSAAHKEMLLKGVSDKQRIELKKILKIMRKNLEEYSTALENDNLTEA